MRAYAAPRAITVPLPDPQHMLCHSTGYKLANDSHDMLAIQGYLGHRSIVSTQRYTPWSGGNRVLFQDCFSPRRAENA
jgi:site-specific recombinase XerC